MPDKEDADFDAYNDKEDNDDEDDEDEGDEE